MVESLIFTFLITFPVVIKKMVVHRPPQHVIHVYLPNGQLEELSLSNISVAVTSPNNILAYRPRFKVNLAALFFNMDAIFPCIESAHYNPTCGILTHEEDVFVRGHSYLQAADSGNTLRIFSSTEYIRTYGFAIEGCAEFSPSCFHVHIAFTLFCLLPREQCG